MNETEQLEELARVEKSPFVLLGPDGRDAVEDIKENGATAQIRARAAALLDAVPCPSCVE